MANTIGAPDSRSINHAVIIQAPSHPQANPTLVEEARAMDANRAAHQMEIAHSSVQNNGRRYWYSQKMHVFPARRLPVAGSPHQG